MSERAVTQHVEGADLFVVAAADTAQFLSWQTLERPPTIDDPFVNVGFDVAPQHTFEAGLYTPVRKATAGQQFRIRRIVVRYRAWATGQGHGFTVGVGKFGARRSSTGQFASYPFRPIATVSGTDEQVEVVQSFTAPASTDSQLTIDVSDDPSEAYWVGIGSMEGVGIGAIEVYGTHEGLVL